MINGYANNNRKSKMKHAKKMPVIKNTQNILKNASGILQQVGTKVQ
jgi:hypothetical protein